MKKLMTLALGLAFVLGAVPVVFAQDTPPTKTEKKAPKKSKKMPKKTDDSKTTPPTK